MLVLSRKVGEEIRIAENVTITILSISGRRVTIGIQAPKSISIIRGELAQDDLDQIVRANTEESSAA